MNSEVTHFSVDMQDEIARLRSALEAARRATEAERRATEAERRATEAERRATEAARRENFELLEALYQSKKSAMHLASALTKVFGDSSTRHPDINHDETLKRMEAELEDERRELEALKTRLDAARAMLH